MSEFKYDYASRRAWTREYDFGNGGWANPVITWHVFAGLNVIQERNVNNQVTAQLVRDGNIAGILSRTTADGPAFYGYDDRGNVALLTNSAGQDVGHYRYDAFGNTLESVGARAGENPYRFSTKELHGPSGLYDFGYRFYSPGMGRWLNRDPIREAGGVNLYGMVGNNPVNAVDAYGLAKDSVTAEVEKAIENIATDPKGAKEILDIALDLNMVTGRAKATVQAAAAMAAAYQQLAEQGRAVIARINPAMFSQMAQRASNVGAKFAQAMQNGMANRQFGATGIKTLNPNIVRKGVEYTHELKIAGNTDRLLGRVVEAGDKAIIEFEYYDVAGKATGHR